MKKMWNKLALLLCLLAGFGIMLTSCGGGSDDDPELELTALAPTVEVGSTITITANYDGKDVTAETTFASDSDLASVDGNVVSGNAAGEVKITGNYKGNKGSTTITVKAPESHEVEPSVNYASSADYWTANSGTIAVTDGVLSVTGVSASGMAIQLNDTTWAEIKDTLGSKFYVQAVLKSKTASDGDKNFGPASIVNSTNGEFAYAGVNANGRTQLGSKTTPKGQQFGSLISDTSLLSAAEWPQYYTLRYEYDNGTITGYINGIQFNKNGTTTYTVTGTGDLGSVGIYACKNDFEMASFVCGAINDTDTNLDTAALQMVTTESTIVTLTSQNADGVNTKYAFLPNVEYEGTAADDPVTFTITSVGYNYNESNWDVENEDATKLKASRSGNKLVITILSQTETTASVTVKNTDKTTAGDFVSRKITVKIKDMPNMVDTDYGTLTVSPSVGATGVYEDDHLELTFDEIPTLSESNGQIYIYDSDNNVVDTLQTVNTNTNVISDGTNKVTHTIPAAEYNVRIDGTKLIVIPHQDALEVNKTYKVVIADGVIAGKINGKDFTGFTPSASRWTFTTRESKPTEKKNIIVGTSANAHYRSVQSAIVAAEDGATITVEKGTYREFLFNKVAKSLTIVGDTTTDYGADVIIEGSNSQLWASGSDDRCMFLWAGKDLTFKNITIANVFDRNKYSTGQSEALYFNSTSHLVAYNSSFKGHHDTLLTKGKNWFYKCYVEGDTDFIWGYADVALFEECEIVMVDTGNDTVPASGAYIFETRVATPASAQIPKGYVLLNCKVAALHSKGNFFARRASAISSDDSKNYYDQAAVINTNFYSDADYSTAATLAEPLWGYDGSKGNKPLYLAKDSAGNMHVGWKYYGGSGYTPNTSKEWYGTIDADTYTAEYSGRNVIFNRVYEKAGSKYVNLDADDRWDTSALATAFTASADTSTLPTDVDDDTVTVKWDWTTDSVTYFDSSKVSATAITSAGGYIKGNNASVYAYAGGGSLKSHASTTGGSNDCANFAKDAYIRIPVSVGSIVTVDAFSGQANYTVGGVEVKSNTYSTDAMTKAGYLEIVSNGSYLNKITVTKLASTDYEPTTDAIEFSKTPVEITVDSDATNLTVSAIKTEPDSSVATASLSGTTLTITPVAKGETSVVLQDASENTATVFIVINKYGAVSKTIDKYTATGYQTYSWYLREKSGTSFGSLESQSKVITSNKELSSNSYGVYTTSDYELSIPVSGAASIIVHVGYQATASSTLALYNGETSIASYTTLNSTGGLNSNMDGIPYAFAYTGTEAKTLTLKVTNQMYIARVYVDNVSLPTASEYTYDFSTVGNNYNKEPLAVSAKETDVKNKLFWTTNGKNYDYAKVYNNGLWGQGATPYLTFAVPGNCTITLTMFVDTSANGTGNLTLYDAALTTTKGSVAVPNATGNVEITYTGDAGLVNLFCPSKTDVQIVKVTKTN